ncbi:MAG: 50S ribosomal protein L16 [Candidatus Aenigmarchaeota archaeon]|nr:50S ribosomal protein L16 [Candidatus Aenigmarchaeota archaeon]
MSLRPAKCYRDFKRPYTRKSRANKSKDYVKGIPESKIHRFEVGSAKQQFSLRLYLVAARSVQIRHNALEATRVSLNKNLDKTMGKDAYFAKILVFPHHVLRENMLATGAGADRFQSGMRLAFGRPVGTAARVFKGSAIVEVRCNQNHEALARRALKIASSKLPTPCLVVASAIAA